MMIQLLSQSFASVVMLNLRGFPKIILGWISIINVLVYLFRSFPTKLFLIKIKGGGASS